MKSFKKGFLVLAVLFSIDFIFSIFNSQTKHEFFFWEIDILFYRLYRLILAAIFIALYFYDNKSKQHK
ncbi:MAG: hypothetical protein RL542_589 [Bacteroidota bacterium]|jgi:ABC-type multidrug transport system permease subunit